GEATGPTWGGTHSIVSWHLQTDQFLPDPADLDGAILVLETSETLPPAREVGYLCRSLGERGLLDGFSGVLVGRPRANYPPTDRDPDFEEYRTAIREEVETQLDRYAPGTTAVFDVDFGHTSPIFPLPLGATARLDPATESLSFV
ncbi:MAG: LD-carboxypeptidase, partial [Halobaculum sp.]